MSSRCLPHNLLTDLHTGVLSDADLEKVATHVDGCTDCQIRLRTITDHGDELARVLRRRHQRNEFADEPAYLRVASAIRYPDVLRGSSSRDSDDEPFPQTIGGCQILGRLGEGGMGRVFRAFHPDLKREVALKILPTARMADDAAIQRFRREMRAVGSLDHVNVVSAMNAGCDGDTHYLVMELVSGVDLSLLLSLTESLPIGAACELIRQAAVGLQHAHEHRLVHRDIKPSNLMATPNGVVKILDLGLARMTDSRFEEIKDLTATNQIMGTLDYMAPEQGSAADSVSIQSDIYSLGATFYKLLSGLAPFSRNEPQPLIERVRNIALGEIVPIQKRRPEVSNDLAVIVHRMLERDPADRFDLPNDVALALEPMADAEEINSIVRDVQSRIPQLQPDSRSSADLGAPLFENIDLRRKRQPWRRKAFFLLAGAALIAGALSFIQPALNKTFVGDPIRNAGPSNEVGSDVLTADSPETVPQTTEPLRLLHGHQSGVKDLLVLEDGRRVASVGVDGRVRMFDIDTAEELWSAQSRRAYDQFHCVAVSNDQSMIAAGGSTYSVYLFDIETGAAKGEVTFNEGAAGISRFGFTHDDKSIVVCRLNGEVDLVNLETSERIRRFAEPVEGSDVLSPLAFAPDHKSFVVSLPDRAIVQFDIETGATVREYRSSQSYWHDFLFKKDGTRLVGTGGSCAVAVWDAATGDHIWSRGTGTKSAHRICVSPDERYWFIGIDNKTIQVIDTTTGLLSHVYRADSFCTQRIDLSPDGRRLVSGAGWHVTDRLRFGVDFRLRVWDTSAFAPAVDERSHHTPP